MKAKEIPIVWRSGESMAAEGHLVKVTGMYPFLVNYGLSFLKWERFQVKVAIQRV